MVYAREARLIIRTGERGTTDDVVIHLNGARLVARKLAGGTDSGEVMLSTLFVGGELHAAWLSTDGPAPWDVDSVELFAITPDGACAYSKTRPEAPLSEGQRASIWAPPEGSAPPPPTPFAV